MKRWNGEMGTGSQTFSKVTNHVFASAELVLCPWNVVGQLRKLKTRISTNLFFFSYPIFIVSLFFNFMFHLKLFCFFSFSFSVYIFKVLIMQKFAASCHKVFNTIFFSLVSFCLNVFATFCNHLTKCYRRLLLLDCNHNLVPFKGSLTHFTFNKLLQISKCVFEWQIKKYIAKLSV